MGEVVKRISHSLGGGNKVAGQIVLFLFIYILIYFLFLGFTTTPETINESDSLDYHIPIARTISRGEFLKPPKLINDIGYYPAIGESILALFIRLKIPLNLFNWLGVILLFIVCLKLGKALKLNEQESVVFASSVILLNSVLRLVLTQTIDIWIAVFFILSLTLLQNPLKKTSYFLKLGISLGLLTGTKYSGVFLALILIIVYLKEIAKKIGLKEFVAFLIPYTFLGLFWYLRNFVFKGNPFYPGSFLFFKGLTEYKIQGWTPLKTILFTKRGFLLFIGALVSEYLIWPIFYLFLPIFVFLRKVKKDKIEKKLILITFLTLAIYLVTPSWPQNLISDLRYLFPSIITLILALFILTKRLKIQWFILLPVLTSASVMPQLSYRPKIVFIWLLLFLAILVFKKSARRGLAKYLRYTCEIGLAK